MSKMLFTIGHSTHSLPRFCELLEQHHITVVADVRSAPYSRRNPHFNREALQAELDRHGIVYVFLGTELGARSSDPRCYRNGKVQYDQLAATDLFRRGLDRVMKTVQRSRLVLLCAESDPIECHRMILVSRRLCGENLAIQHILNTGELEPHKTSEQRLMRLHGLTQDDMFSPAGDRLEKAYLLQESRIAYFREPPVERQAGS